MKSRSWKTSRAIVCSSSSLRHATDGVGADEVEVASPVGGGDEFLACCLVHFENDKQIRTFQKFQSAPSLTAVELRVRRAAHELGLPALALLLAVLLRALTRALPLHLRRMKTKLPSGNSETLDEPDGSGASLHPLLALLGSGCDHRLFRRRLQ